MFEREARKEMIEEEEDEEAVAKRLSERYSMGEFERMRR
jgi:hypothetical protein